MKYRDPLKTILQQTRSHWDHDRFRSDARGAFLKVLQCRTLALGAEVYASKNQERIVFHTCKSRACPSCGHRATIQWQRERWAALPDVRYKGITFTMPRPLWKIFGANRSLAVALPALAASVIQGWIRAKHGLQIGVMAILHTFNGRLEYNSHVHTMVSAGGLHAPSGLWVPSVYFDNDRLMTLWRNGVITLLREAHKADLLRTEASFGEMEAMLTHHEGHWWSVKIQSFDSREHFLRYAGRYVKRPPIAQRRITYIGKTRVKFWTKDKKLRRRVEVLCSPEEFIDRWTQHVPDRYRHSVRGFGLFAPRVLGNALTTIFRIVGQQQRSRPRPRRWADSIKRDFGKNPLLDQSGHRMQWMRRLAPTPVG